MILMLILMILTSIIGCYISLRLWILRMRRKMTTIYNKKLAGNISVDENVWLQHASQHKFKSITAVFIYWFNLYTGNLRRDLSTIFDEMFKLNDVKKNPVEFGSATNIGVSPEATVLEESPTAKLSPLDTDKLKEDANSINPYTDTYKKSVKGEDKSMFSDVKKTEKQLKAEHSD